MECAPTGRQDQAAVLTVGIGNFTSFRLASSNAFLKRTLLTELLALDDLHSTNALAEPKAYLLFEAGIKAKISDPNRHSGANGGRGFIDAVACPVSEVTIRLSALLGRPVVDMTGDERKFDLHLKWAPDDTRAGGAASDSPSLFTALQEQLGLKLESGKVSAGVLIVDHAELPSDN